MWEEKERERDSSSRETSVGRKREEKEREQDSSSRETSDNYKKRKETKMPIHVPKVSFYWGYTKIKIPFVL